MSQSMLPHIDTDDVLALHAHYFLAADLMRNNYERYGRFRRKRTRSEKVDESLYLITWLGYLGVVCEGFKRLGIRKLLIFSRPKNFSSLNPIADRILSHLKKNDDALRKLRNATFHLRDKKGLSDIIDFFHGEEDRLTWVRLLHKLLEEFFSDYRIECAVTYISENRLKEWDEIT